MGFTPSKYQSAIDQQYTTTQDNLLISAVAGSGKTTTLLQLLNKTAQPAIFLAFNKSIADEIKDRVGYNPLVNIMTMHSLGMRAILRHFDKRIEVKNNKSWELMKKMDWKFDTGKARSRKAVISNLCNVYRMTMCSTIDQLAQAGDDLGIVYEQDDLQKALQLVDAYNHHNQDPTIIDFTDMIYIPASNPSITIPFYPKVVFVDECQDLNKSQHRLIDRLINENSARFVACGDPYQSIYGFAGAHSKSFNLFKDKNNVQQMPLSICYRCSSSIIDEANKVYDIMEPFEHSSVGTVGRLDSIDQINEGDMVICRNVRPLVDVFFHLLSDGKKATIRGKDIGTALIKMIKPYSNQSTMLAVSGLNQQLFDIVTELSSRGIENPKEHKTYVLFEEKVGIIRKLGKEFIMVNDLMNFLEKMFADDKRDGVILSTIHKSKGLENDTVIILNKFLIPSKFARTPDQLKQEQNLLYVATTRAKKKLMYLNHK